jgi:uncharacterized protein YuzE
MKILYFEKTDTLHLGLNPAPVAETRDLNDDVTFDFDESGNLSGITMEHATINAGLPFFSFEKVAA